MDVNKVSAIGVASAADPPIGAVRPADPAAGLSRRSSQPEQQHPTEPDTVVRRYPWLSWETRALEAASKQPSPYGRVPVLGETLDQRV